MGTTSYGVRRRYVMGAFHYHHDCDVDTVQAVGEGSGLCLSGVSPPVKEGIKGWLKMGFVFNHTEQTLIRKRLRNNATNAERKLWSKLKHSQLLGYKFRRQHGIGSFIVDFYYHEAALAIEIDGETHHTDEEIAYDTKRQMKIEESGIKLLRFTNRDVYDNMNGVLMAISEKLKEISTTPYPFLDRRGEETVI